MTAQEGISYMRQQLAGIYDEGEARVISEWVMENLTGLRASDRLSQKAIALSTQQTERLQQLLLRLQQQEPVQYVLNECWFCGFRFYVDDRVLIPRPETEELVEWIISNCRFPIDQLHIFDIGTGSGCIPIALKRKLRRATVSACDISSDALAVARKNAKELGAEINFYELDFLQAPERSSLPQFDLIVSNPPYIPQAEITTMAANVVNFEPHTALFVPDQDALVFYRAIATFGKDHLLPTGSIFLEMHEGMGAAITQLFHEAGYAIELKKDMQGKERMAMARLKAGR